MTKYNMWYAGMRTKEHWKGQESGFEASFGISTMLQSSAIKGSGGSDGKRVWLYNQKVLGLIPSRIPDFFSFMLVYHNIAND